MAQTEAELEALRKCVNRSIAYGSLSFEVSVIYFPSLDQTVSQCEKSHRCHAERSEASRIFSHLRRRDPSASPQDEIATLPLMGEGIR